MGQCKFLAQATSQGILYSNVFRPYTTCDASAVKEIVERLAENSVGKAIHNLHICRFACPLCKTMLTMHASSVQGLRTYRSSQNYYRQSCYSWEFIFPKLPLPLPSWNSDEFPLPLPSWRPQSPLHFHWFPITVFKVIWINFPQITVTVTVLNCFWIRKVIVSNMTVL